jgi:hypothetical protein
MEEPRRQPVEELRGIDPHLFDERGTHATILVNAPCERIASALTRHPEMLPGIADALAGPVPIEESDIEPTIFLYQLRGHDWTQINGRIGYICQLSEHLSRELCVPAFRYMYDHITGVYGYAIFHNGELQEELSRNGAFIYEGESGQMYRQQSEQNGYRVNTAGDASFMTKRGTALDVESPDECGQQLEKAAKDLGLYVAADLLYVAGSGLVECWLGWAMSDLQAAKVMRALSFEEKERQRMELEGDDEEEELELAEGSDAWRRLQETIAKLRGDGQD